MTPCDLVEITMVIEKELDVKVICNNLLDKRLVASTHYTKVASSFIWKNKKESNSEFKVDCITERNKLNSIEEVVKKLHPYEVFQLTMIPITECNKDFKEWVHDVLNS